MILLFHIFIALSSLGFSTYLFFFPSNFRLKLSYISVVLTLISGTYLVLITHSNLVQACMSGLIYLGVVSAAIFSARHKLAT